MLVTEGPTLPTLALRQVVRYVRYTGRGANAVATAARDSSGSYANCRAAGTNVVPRLNLGER